MTLDEMIAAERRAVDTFAWDRSNAQRKRYYRQMRAHSERHSAPDAFPNNVTVSDAWLQLTLRARDIIGLTDPSGYYLPLTR